MKKIVLLLLPFLLSLPASAKKLRFTVDMDTITVNPTGVHVFGDFQAVAGFPGGDWQSNTTPMTQVGTSTLYSVIVDIPAFVKYEYKFINGDQSYEVEFVPDQARVGYNFNDNRWIFLDSLADDTTDMAAVVFSENAPAGLELMRLYVDMQSVLISPPGVHVAGDFQGWNPATTRMYSFGGTLYEIIAYGTAGTYQYRFYNGNTASDSETVPASCMVNFNREIQVSSDTLVDIVCLSSCTACPTGIPENEFSSGISLAPNPASLEAVLKFEARMKATVSLFDISGRRVISKYVDSEKNLRIDCRDLEAGTYFIHVLSATGMAAVKKLLIQ